MLSIVIRPNDVRYANIIIMPLQNARACLHAQWHCANQCNPICLGCEAGRLHAWVHSQAPGWFSARRVCNRCPGYVQEWAKGTQGIEVENIPGLEYHGYITVSVVFHRLHFIGLPPRDLRHLFNASRRVSAFLATPIPCAFSEATMNSNLKFPLALISHSCCRSFWSPSNLVK